MTASLSDHPQTDTFGVSLSRSRASSVRGRDDADVPVLLLCGGDQFADIAGYSGRADDDVQERLLRLLAHARAPVDN